MRRSLLKRAKVAEVGRSGWKRTSGSQTPTSQKSAAFEVWKKWLEVHFWKLNPHFSKVGRGPSLEEVSRQSVSKVDT
jgi:hypothetical protein